MSTENLAARLRRRIHAEGPLTVAAYMGEALAAYYGTRDPLGQAGDFITAPEISQMFGEVIGAWIAEQWQALGRPAPVNLVELGPGRGTLMADVMRVLRRVPGLLDAARIQLVETSPTLRKRQRAALGPAEITWHDALGKVPDGPLLLIANEFFDALPIRQLLRTGLDGPGGGWAERCIGLDGENFVWLLDARTGPLLVPPDLRDAEVGSVVELCPAGIAIAGEIGGRIARSGGAALLIDYGYAAPTCMPTLQAVRAHRFADVLEAPGEADLTAHVDFAALAAAARAAGADAHGPVGQGDLLRRLGIVGRAAALRRLATPEQAADIDAALARLVDETAMGSLFKALALTGPGMAPPPGFEAA